MEPGQLIPLVAGAATGIFVHPDWDVDSGDISHYYVRRVLGKPGDLVWEIWTQPYADAISHRGVISHFPIIGTLIRLIYCLFPIIIVLIPHEGWSKTAVKSIVAQAISIPLLCAILLLFSPDWFVPFAVGLACADTLHAVFDIIF